MANSAMKDAVVRTSDAVDLFVREWGDPDGPEILFVHGLAQCHLSFAKQTASFLADGHRIVAFDLRGHGASAKPLAPEHYQDGRRWADDVEAVMAAKRLKRPVIVGWSLGGRVVRQYLIHHGDGRLSGINFLATRPIEHESVVGPGSKAASEADKTDLGNRLKAEIAFLKDCYAIQPPADELALQIAYNALLPHQVRAAIGAWKVDPATILEALGKVKVPTLISHGRHDRLILPRAAEMTAEAVRPSRISWYEDCGHSPFYEAADRYNRELAEFVASAWRPGP
jgi:pimeloyl-ACP methyl ester carboxylesterase